MDPFSAEGGQSVSPPPVSPHLPSTILTQPSELLNIHTAFHQGQYALVPTIDISNLSPSNKTPALVLQYRARIALGDAKTVLSDLQSQANDKNAADFAAVKAFAQHASGRTAQGLQEAEQLAESEGENATVQILAGTVLQAAGKTEEALALLSKHQGNLEA